MTMVAVTGKTACSSPDEWESDAGETTLDTVEHMAKQPPEATTGVDYLATARRLQLY